MKKDKWEEWVIDLKITREKWDSLTEDQKFRYVEILWRNIDILKERYNILFNSSSVVATMPFKPN